MKRSIHQKSSLWLAIIILTLTGSYYYLHRIIPAPLRQPLRALPTLVGDWRGQEISPQESPLRLNGADEELVRIYQDTLGRTVGLSISYFNSQDQSRKLAGYLSNPLHRNALAVDIPYGTAKSHQANRVVLSRAGRRWAVLYWYDLNGRIVTDRFTVKLHTILDAGIRGRSNGALVLVFRELRPGEDISVLRIQDSPLLQTLLPLLHTYFQPTV